MSRRALHWLVGLGALAAALVAAPCARAEGEQLVLAAGDEAAGVPPRVLSIDVEWGVPAQASTGWGFARVDLANGDSEARTVRVEIGSPRFWGGDLTEHAVRSVRIDAGRHVRLWMPRLSGYEHALRVSVPGHGYAELGGGRSQQALVRVLFVADGANDTAAFDQALTAVMGTTPSRTSRSPSPAGFTTVYASDLPPTWTYLTSASLIVVDASAQGLDDAERQRTLVRYARAGGTLLVLARAALPRGPLMDCMPPATGSNSSVERRACGFGAVLATDAITLRENAGSVVERWFAHTMPADAEQVAEGTSVVSSGLALSETIPGLGRVPARTFFFVLLLFTVLVGPVAYIVLKRRRRLIQLIAVVPATGLAFAVAILVFGLLSEGLGTRGVVRTFSILDQREHEATCVAGRTLFAGFGPDALRLSPDTVLYAPAIVADSSTYWSDDRRTAGRFDLDADDGRLDGSVLPSRTVTSFSTASRSRARERLRFRRLPQGTYEVLSTEDFALVKSPGSILFCAPDGKYFGGDGSNEPLSPLDEKQAADILAANRLKAAAFERLEEEVDPSTLRGYGLAYYRSSWSSWTSTTPVARDRGIAATRVVPSRLSPGSYLAWTTPAPGFDDLGLSVEWKSQSHLVLGLLADDDIDG